MFLNDRPGGIKCLRPFLRTFEKETAVMAIRIYREHENEISNLMSLTFEVNSKSVTTVY